MNRREFIKSAGLFVGLLTSPGFLLKQLLPVPISVNHILVLAEWLKASLDEDMCALAGLYEK